MGQNPKHNAAERSPLPATREMMKASAAKTIRLWKASRGPVKVDRYSLAAALAIDALLSEPLAVLPKGRGDIVLPLAIGIGTAVEALMRPDATDAP